MKKNTNEKQKILETATRLFQRKGFNVIGINQIIEEANVNPISFYEHFNSKAELLIAYLDVFQQKWYESLTPYLYSIADPGERLLGLFEFRIYYQEKFMFPGCPFMKINAEIGLFDERLNLRVRDGKDYFRAFVRDMVSGTKHKQILCDEELTDLIFLLIEGGLSSAVIYQSAADLKKGRDLLRSFL